MRIGDRIRSIRKLRGLTQKRLARRLGVTQQLISDIELQKCDIEPELLQPIADALDVPLRAFFERNYDKT